MKKRRKQSTKIKVSGADYLRLQHHAERERIQKEILQRATCTPNAHLRTKLAAMEALKADYSVHALCDAMGVSRGTFYNYQRDKAWFVMSHVAAKVIHDSTPLGCLD